MPQHWVNVFIGLILIVAVLIDIWLRQANIFATLRDVCAPEDRNGKPPMPDRDHAAARSSRCATSARLRRRAAR